VLVYLGLTKTMPPSHPVWRRIGALALGGFFIYLAVAYYLPKYRRQREELERDLDEAERELDEIERRARPR
jgi:hypothetical protein